MTTVYWPLLISSKDLFIIVDLSEDFQDQGTQLRNNTKVVDTIIIQSPWKLQLLPDKGTRLVSYGWYPCEEFSTKPCKPQNTTITIRIVWRKTERHKQWTRRTRKSWRSRVEASSLANACWRRKWKWTTIRSVEILPYVESRQVSLERRIFHSPTFNKGESSILQLCATHRLTYIRGQLT